MLNQELKEKIVSTIENMDEADITDHFVYKCMNDCKMCFNGQLVRAINGNDKYDPKNFIFTEKENEKLRNMIEDGIEPDRAKRYTMEDGYHKRIESDVDELIGEDIRGAINRIHYRYCNGELDFEEARQEILNLF